MQNQAWEGTHQESWEVNSTARAMLGKGLVWEGPLFISSMSVSSAANKLPP